MKSGIAVSFLLALGAVAHAQTVIDHSAGFAGQTDMTLNGGAAVNGTLLRMTDAIGQLRTAFSTNAVDITRFDTTFEFDVTELSVGATIADGLAFVIQSGAATLIGTGGGGELAYQAIANSVGVKFDTFMGGSDPSASCTGLLTGGTTGMTGGTDLLLPVPAIDFRDANLKRARLQYDGTTLTVTITDMVTAAVKIQTYTVDIPTLVAGTTARVGFTAATGGEGAFQDIVTWTYTVLPPPPGAPTGLTATGQLSQILVTWNAVTATPAVTSYNVWRRVQQVPPVAFAVITNVAAPTTQYLDTGVVAGVIYEYVVTAVSTAGQSANSNMGAAQATFPPRTNSHEEGLFGDQCACGSSIPAAPLVPALAALAALSLALRRKVNR